MLGPRMCWPSSGRNCLPRAAHRSFRCLALEWPWERQPSGEKQLFLAIHGNRSYRLPQSMGKGMAFLCQVRPAAKVYCGGGGALDAFARLTR